MRQFKNRLLKAAFKVGDTVQYMGNRKSWTVKDGKEIPYVYPGMLADVVETREPDKGFGFIRNDEDGEPVIDYGDDGHNVIVNQFGERRLLWPKDKKEWRKI